MGQHVTQADLDDDWVLSHEMIHFGFPSVEGRHHWIEVGIATYVEPIARAQVGRLTAERVWREMVDGMPQGLPAAGDQGLDNTHTRGRTSWGARCSASWRKSRFESRQAMPRVSGMLCGPSTARSGRLRPTGRLSASFHGVREARSYESPSAPALEEVVHHERHDRSKIRGEAELCYFMMKVPIWSTVYSS